MRQALAVLLLAGCQARAPVPGAPEQVIEVAGRPYSVRLVEGEPQPVSDIVTLEDGRQAVGPNATFEGQGPAIRVGGAINSQPAAEAVRQFCDSRGSGADQLGPVRFDDVTTDHVFYMTC